MKKYIPNMISCIRIIGALILIIFFKEFSSAYLIIYGISAATDAIDGYLARRFDVCSVVGVVFDTVGDALIGLALVKVLLMKKELEPWFILWLIVTVLLFLTAAIISYVKFGKFSFPHTYFDKLLGCLVASSPFIYVFAKDVLNNVNVLYFIVGAVFFIASIESVIIELKLKQAKPFVPSVFHTDK